MEIVYTKGGHILHFPKSQKAAQSQTWVFVADVVIDNGQKSCSCACFVVPAGRTVLFGQDVIRRLQLLSPADVNRVRVTPIGITVDPKATPVALPPTRHASVCAKLLKQSLTDFRRPMLLSQLMRQPPGCHPWCPLGKQMGP